MSVPSVITGVNAVISGIPTMGMFKIIQRSSSKKAIYTSSGNGGALRKCGNVDFTGFIHAFGYMPPTIGGSMLWVNNTFTLAGSLYGAAGDGISCSAVFVTGIDVFWPVGEKLIERSYINYVIHFASAGVPLAFANGASLADAAAPNMYCAQGMTVSIDGTPEPNVEWMELSIRSMSEPYVNSTLNGIYSRAAGNFDWAFKYHRNVNSLSLMQVVDSIHTLQIAVPSTTISGATVTDPYWQLKFGIFSEPLVVTVSHESPLPITAESEADMTGFSGTTAGGVWVPGGTEVWAA